MGGWFSPKFCIFERKFSNEKKILRFSKSQNLGGGEIAPLNPLSGYDTIGAGD